MPDKTLQKMQRKRYKSPMIINNQETFDLISHMIRLDKDSKRIWGISKPELERIQTKPEIPKRKQIQTKSKNTAVSNSPTQMNLPKKNPKAKSR